MREHQNQSHTTPRFSRFDWLEIVDKNRAHFNVARDAEEEFWNIYDRLKYDALGTKLPSVYQKARSKYEFQKSNATKGFFSAIIGKTSLLSTK